MLERFSCLANTRKFLSIYQFLPVLLLWCLIFGVSAQDAFAKSNPRYASIVVDANTGMIISQQNADKILHPASLAKMMTLLLTFEALEQKTISLQDKVRISKHAAGMVPSKLGLEVGETIRVEDAIYALVTKSANDVAVALAEHLSGTEQRFARHMTLKARALGMRRTNFENASGLHNKRQVTTAKDMAILSRYLMTKYDHYYHYFSTREYTYQGKTYRNHNTLMRYYKGMDGLKTGYIRASGFNLAASARRGDNRIIGVVFGGRTAKSRNAHMAQLLDRGFREMDSIMIAAIRRPVPLPGQKPNPNMMAALNEMAPAAGLIEQIDWAALSPVFSRDSYLELQGQGDIDQDMTARLDAGLLSMAAVMKQITKNENPVERLRRQASYRERLSLRDAQQKWGIQIGAFKSRARTDKAIDGAMKSLSGDLTVLQKAISPVKTRDGWLFRGRILGFSKAEAIDACYYLDDCIPVAPEAM